LPPAKLICLQYWLSREVKLAAHLPGTYAGRIFA
jgi:hypothetical protein